MVDNVPKQYSTEELDPVLLASPYSVQTNWHVITGAACCGKTTLIELLANKGFRTAAETARGYFEQQLAKGRSLEEIHQNSVGVQLAIDKMQRDLESELDPQEIVFLDRACPDSIVFFRIFGVELNKVLCNCFQYRYASVFLLDRLPFGRENTLGPEDDFSSDFIDQWLERDYSALGYHVVRVPVVPPEARVEFILDRLTEGGLI